MSLDPTLRDQFQAATYSVKGLASMRIGEPLPTEVRAWIRAYQSTAISVLGAENPQGMRASEVENENRHNALIKELDQRGLTWFPASGFSADWEERHVMIVGLSRDETIDFKHRYDQAAVLYAYVEGVVEIL